MDIILHLGAHRTATTSFQHYMRANRQDLETQGIAFWGPEVTRGGLLSGILPEAGTGAAARPGRARGRLALRLQGVARSGARHLVISDENMIGAPRQNLRLGRLYPGIGERVARLADAFGGRVACAALSIRAQDAWWASALAYGVARGHRLPTAADLDRLVTVNRNWRGVITDLACALPGAEILILPHETYAGLPDERLRLMTGIARPPRAAARDWLGRSPDLAHLRRALSGRGGAADHLPDGEGRWQPFDRYQRQALQAAYADDLSWLAAGAEGLARLCEETGPAEAGRHPPAGQTRRGRHHGTDERRLA